MRQAKYLISDGSMVANVDTTRFCRLIVLVANRAVVRDLEVLVRAHANYMRIDRFPREGFDSVRNIYSLHLMCL